MAGDPRDQRLHQERRCVPLRQRARQVQHRVATVAHRANGRPRIPVTTSNLSETPPANEAVVRTA